MWLVWAPESRDELNTMVNSFVHIPFRHQAAVGFPTIWHNSRPWQNPLFDDRDQSCSWSVLNRNEKTLRRRRVPLNTAENPDPLNSSALVIFTFTKFTLINLHDLARSADRLTMILNNAYTYFTTEIIKVDDRELQSSECIRTPSSTPQWWYTWLTGAIRRKTSVCE